MPKIPVRISTLLTIILCVVLFAAMIVGAFYVPGVVANIVEMSAEARTTQIIENGGKVALTVFFYSCLAIVMVADVFIFALILRVRAGGVFTDKTVALIRGIAWCCFLLSAALFGIGLYLKSAFVGAFAAAFLGLCIRVVKNVIEQANIIKSENDLTV